MRLGRGRVGWLQDVRTRLQQEAASLTLECGSLADNAANLRSFWHSANDRDWPSNCSGNRQSGTSVEVVCDPALCFVQFS